MEAPPGGCAENELSNLPDASDDREAPNLEILLSFAGLPGVVRRKVLVNSAIAEELSESTGLEGKEEAVLAEMHPGLLGDAV
ncbi:MAG: hypothetical protein K2P28_04325 [Lachnospiraceae bacterium]|nr:hypothetical protein [Lachnospiraceae bacterium]